MWESFREDVADYVAALAKDPFCSPGDFVDVTYHHGHNEESVRSVHGIILSALLRFHEFEECEIASTHGSPPLPVEHIEPS